MPRFLETRRTTKQVCDKRQENTLCKKHLSIMLTLFLFWLWLCTGKLQSSERSFTSTGLVHSLSRDHNCWLAIKAAKIVFFKSCEIMARRLLPPAFSAAPFSSPSLWRRTRSAPAKPSCPANRGPRRRARTWATEKKTLIVCCKLKCVYCRDRAD